MDKYIAPRIERKIYPMDMPVGTRFKFEGKPEVFMKITEKSYIAPDHFDGWASGQSVPMMSFQENQPIITHGLPGRETIDAIERRLLLEVEMSGKEWHRHDVDHLITKSRGLIAQRIARESE